MSDWNEMSAIDSQIQRVRAELEKLNTKLEKLKRKKEVLLRLPEICPSCSGTGRERYTDEAGSGDWRDCRTCKGLGRVAPLKCESCGRIAGTDMVYWRRQYTRLEVTRCPWCGGAMEYHFVVEEG